MLVLGVIIVAALTARPARRRVDCGPLLASAEGSYPALAAIDAEGYVRPFGKLVLDEDARWELEINDAYEGKHRVADLSRIRRWQRLRFGCTGGDYGTPETAIRILRNGAVVYETEVVLGEGLQNREFGFIEASNRLMFWWLLRSL